MLRAALAPCFQMGPQMSVGFSGPPAAVEDTKLDCVEQLVEAGVALSVEGHSEGCLAVSDPFLPLYAAGDDVLRWIRGALGAVAAGQGRRRA